MKNIQFIIVRDEDYLEHHGVPGMKKGVRKDGKPSTWRPISERDDKTAQVLESHRINPNIAQDGEDEDEDEEKRELLKKKRKELVDKHSNKKAKDLYGTPSHSKGADAVNKIMNKNGRR